MIGETRVDPDALTGRHKFRKDKAERMESVLEGRQDRSYGAAAGRRKQKLGESYCASGYGSVRKFSCVCKPWGLI